MEIYSFLNIFHLSLFIYLSYISVLPLYHYSLRLLLLRLINYSTLTFAVKRHDYCIKILLILTLPKTDSSLNRFSFEQHEDAAVTRFLSDHSWKMFFVLINKISTQVTSGNRMT